MSGGFDPIAYDPDLDPLIQRMRKRSPKGSSMKWVIIIVLAGWIIYSDVFPNFSSKVRTAVRRESSDSMLLEGGTVTGPPVGVLKHRWSEGGLATYGISSVVRGRGNPALTGTTGLSVNFDADFSLQADKVESDGAAIVRIDFVGAHMYGNFLGTSMDRFFHDGMTEYHDPPYASPAVTALNKKYSPPVFENFDAPTFVRFSPMGVPLGAETVEGHSRFAATVAQLAGIAFPEGERSVGDTWHHDVDIHFPGLKKPIPVRITTTIEEKTNYMGQECVRLYQDISTKERKERILKVARIEIEGDSTSFYDINQCRLIHSETDLYFDLIMPKGLAKAADVFGVFSGLLDELEGGQEFDLHKAAAQDDSEREPIGFTVQYTFVFEG